jgi:hypothetical protein
MVAGLFIRTARDEAEASAKPQSGVRKFSKGSRERCLPLFKYSQVKTQTIDYEGGFLARIRSKVIIKTVVE